MKAIGIISKIGMKAVKVVAGIIAFSLVTYGSYAVWDTMHTERSAYATSSLAQYRPKEASNLSFTDLKEINPDTNAWITLYDTHIDYPIVQGSDDLEYASKDIYKNASPSGAVYLAADLKDDYTGDYNVLYAHHMDNGAMFGDLDNFNNETYLSSHKRGVLITPDTIYDINVLACVQSTAYDDIIYDYGKKKTDFGFFSEYIRRLTHTGSASMIEKADKLLILSTCSDSETNGRTVLITELMPNTGGLMEIEDESAPLGLLLGHKESHWAFLNLCCVILTVFILLPVTRLREKYKRGKKMKDINKQTAQLLDGDEDYKLHTDKRFIRTFKAGVILEIITAILSIVFFILTENMRYPLVLTDKWTGIMIVILLAGFLCDVFFCRHQNKSGRESKET